MKFMNIENEVFKCFDTNFGPIIEGVIHIAGLRMLLWGHNGIEKERICHDVCQLPPGWSLACDLDVQIEREVYRLTLLAGAYEFAFKPYMKCISAQGKFMEEVLTCITVRQSGKGYAALDFREVLSSHAMF